MELEACSAEMLFLPPPLSWSRGWIVNSWVVGLMCLITRVLGRGARGVYACIYVYLLSI